MVKASGIATNPSGPLFHSFYFRASFGNFKVVAPPRSLFLILLLFR